jgi:hypothetical protein
VPPYNQQYRTKFFVLADVDVRGGLSHGVRKEK